MSNSNALVNGFVPKNVSKFPIEQTYFTADSEGTGEVGYRFKMPEIWSSARSAKKSIAIRSIEKVGMNKYHNMLSFKMLIKNSDETINEFGFSQHISNDGLIMNVINNIGNAFKAWNTTITSKKADHTLFIEYNDYHTINFYVIGVDKTSKTESTTKIKITSIDDESKPSDSFNIFFNQPPNHYLDYSEELTYTNVLSGMEDIYFHASLIPFDTYRYLGKVGTIYPKPIVYQDPNSSPIFTVWTTLNFKDPFPIYQDFIIRFSFVLSYEDHV